jgi:Pyridoxamine 5'-phosphate oxidase
VTKSEWSYLDLRAKMVLVRESAEDVERLQSHLIRSMDRAGSFLRASFQMPEHSLSAHQLVRYLQGSRTAALATVTAKGEPRVAPIGSLFWRARFYLPTVANAARTKHILARSAVSLTHFADIDLAVIVHGHAMSLSLGDPDFDELDDLHREMNGVSVQDWGVGVFLKIEADVTYTYARHPERYPE